MLRRPICTGSPRFSLSSSTQCSVSGVAEEGRHQDDAVIAPMRSLPRLKCRTTLTFDPRFSFATPEATAAPRKCVPSASRTLVPETTPNT